MQANPADVEEKIRATTVMKRIRITEYFLDFDKLRKGTVTKDQFRRILSMMGFELTETEYGALEDTYHNEDGHMKYTEFCSSIDKAFTIKGIDKDPTCTVKQVTVDDSLKARRKGMELDEATRKKLFEALQTASKLVLTQRFNMKPFFQAFDVTQCGYVSKTQFTRVLSQVGLKPTEDTLNFILKYYMNKGNLDEVNYVDFVNDVDKPEAIYLIPEKDFSLKTVQKLVVQKEEKLNARKEIVSRKPEDIDDVLGLIRTKVKQERIRLGEFLRDFDKLRSGLITQSQFRIGLNMGKITLSNAEFDHICEHFGSDPVGKVRWRDFVDAIEEVFTLKGLEQKPTIEVEEAKTEMKYGKLSSSEHEAVTCAEIVEKFG
jgi:Ca2+-binding EF-hand superfamily protein